MENKKQLLFLDEFKGLEDPRSNRNMLHHIGGILFTTSCAMLAGDGWGEIEGYGRKEGK